MRPNSDFLSMGLQDGALIFRYLFKNMSCELIILARISVISRQVSCESPFCHTDDLPLLFKGTGEREKKADLKREDSSSARGG